MEDNSLESRSVAVSKVVFRQVVVSMIFLPILIAVLFFSVKNIKAISDKTNELVAYQPVSRFDVMDKDIDKTHLIIEDQYSKHLNNMEDEGLLKLNKRFTAIFDSAFNSEKQYADFLTFYQQGTYQVARSVRGSGEWFEFYTIDLNTLIEKSESRSRSLAKFTNTSPNVLSQSESIESKK